jgi:hypothetical protein
VKDVQLVEPLLASTEDLVCWKHRHECMCEEDGMMPAMQE